MAFSEAAKLNVKENADFTCCWCRDLRNKVEIHHIIPQADGGSDDEDNAAPLCGSCHNLLGGNPDLRKEIRQRRNQWYELCSKRLYQSPSPEQPKGGDELEHHLAQESPSCLWLRKDEEPGCALLLETHARHITIGRALKNTVQVSDPEVSWEHGQIILMQGTYYYHHLSGSNPSILRRRGEEYLLRQGKKEEIPLRNQDRLTIGQTTFIIEFDLIAEDEGYTTTAKKPAVAQTGEGKNSVSGVSDQAA